MSEDARMRERINEPDITVRNYTVNWGTDTYATKDRHSALQKYIAKRLELNDFATDPKEYIVRFFCNDKEYLCDQESYPPGPGKDRGKSCRQVNGNVRPYYWERHIP